MINPCIGIISYLPDDKNIRRLRLRKLKSLLLSCNKIFGIPVIVIAQNYMESDRKEISGTLSYYFDKLGITGARKKLREIFIESDFDWLIMLDDDCELSGISAERYMRQLEDNPACFIEFQKTLLKLFAISKDLFVLVDYDDINPEDAEGFEDRIFVNKLRKKYPKQRREFKNTGLRQISMSTADPLSTWYHGQNLKVMLDKTTETINNL